MTANECFEGLKGAISGGDADSARIHAEGLLGWIDGPDYNPSEFTYKISEARMAIREGLAMERNPVSVDGSLPMDSIARTADAIADATHARAKASHWVAFRWEDVKTAFIQAQAKMVEAMKINPTQAINGRSEGMVEAQARYVAWDKVHTMLVVKDDVSLADAIARAKEELETLYRHGYVPNSTSAFHNAERAHTAHTAIREWMDIVRTLEHYATDKD